MDSNFEEFKGTGNSELILDRKVLKKIYRLDIIDLEQEKLFAKDELSKMNVLKIISPMGTMDGISF